MRPLMSTLVVILAFYARVTGIKWNKKAKAAEIKVINSIIANDAITLCLSQTTGILANLKARHGVTCNLANDPLQVPAAPDEKPLPALPSDRPAVPASPLTPGAGRDSPPADGTTDTSSKPADAGKASADTQSADTPTTVGTDFGGSPGLAMDEKLKTFDHCFSKAVLSSETFAKNEAAGDSLTKEDFNAAIAGQICPTYVLLNSTSLDLPKTGVWAKIGRFIATKSAKAFFSEWKACAAEQPMRIDEFFCQDENVDKWKVCAAAKAAARMRKIKAGQEVLLTPEERQKYLVDDLDAMAKEERQDEKDLIKTPSWMTRLKTAATKVKTFFVKEDKKTKDDNKKDEDKPKSSKWYSKSFHWLVKKAKKAGKAFMDKFIGCKNFRAAKIAAANLSDASAGLRRRRESEQSSIACFSVMVLFQGICLVIALVAVICIVLVFTGVITPGPHSLPLLAFALIGIFAAWLSLMLIYAFYKRFNCCLHDSNEYCSAYKGSSFPTEPWAVQMN